MNTNYDPHLLYHAINITLELQYKVPMKIVYRILESFDQKNIKFDNYKDLIDMIKKLGIGFQKKIIKEESDENAQLELKDQIKLMLELLGCNLSNAELNQILKGELSLDDVLNKQARMAWDLFFSMKDGRTYPDKDNVAYMMTIMSDFAFMDMDMKFKKELAKQTQINLQKQSQNYKIEYALKDTYKTQEQKLINIGAQLKKLKLYIAHMQGYDRDLDRDGSRGIDMETGEIVDYDDIFIADKRFSGAIVEDLDMDGIDMKDIK